MGETAGLCWVYLYNFEKGRSVNKHILVLLLILPKIALVVFLAQTNRSISPCKTYQSLYDDINERGSNVGSKTQSLLSQPTLLLFTNKSKSLILYAKLVYIVKCFIPAWASPNTCLSNLILWHGIVWVSILCFDKMMVINKSRDYFTQRSAAFGSLSEVLAEVVILWAGVVVLIASSLITWLPLWSLAITLTTLYFWVRRIRVWKLP